MTRNKRCSWVRKSHPQATTHVWQCAVAGCRCLVEKTGRGKPEQTYPCGQWPWSQKEAA